MTPPNDFNYINNKKIFEFCTFFGSTPPFIENAISNVISATKETLIKSGVSKPELDYFIIENDIDVFDLSIDLNNIQPMSRLFVTHNPKISSDAVRETMLFIMLFFAAAAYRFIDTLE